MPCSFLTREMKMTGAPPHTIVRVKWIAVFKYLEYCQTGQKSSVNVNQTLNANINYRVNGRCDRDLFINKSALNAKSFLLAIPATKKGICDLLTMQYCVTIVKNLNLDQSWLSWYWISYSSRGALTKSFKSINALSLLWGPRFNALKFVLPCSLCHVKWNKMLWQTIFFFSPRSSTLE